MKRLWFVLLITSFFLLPLTLGTINGAKVVKLIYNGNEVSSDPAPQIINGKTFVPLKFIGDLLGVQVSWDQKKYAVLIGYKPNENFVDLVDGIRPFKIDQHSKRMNTIRIKGIPYSKGYFSEYNTWTDINWNLNKQYSKITFSSGCPDDQRETQAFEIFGDGQKIGGTENLKTQDGIKAYSFDITGIEILSIKNGAGPILDLRAYY